MTKKLTAAELEAATQDLSGWKIADGKLHKQYRFDDFIHAFGFMATAAIAIEKADHHPEWFNSYNEVRVDLATHDAGGISAKDITLAALLDSIAAKLQ